MNKRIAEIVVALLIVHLTVTSVQAVGIAAGSYHAFKICKNGTLWAWGNNTYGQLGDGTTTCRNRPVQVVDLSGVSAVAGDCGVSGFSLALKNDSTVWAWGYNGYGQLGDGTGNSANHPVQVLNLSNVSAVAAGGTYSLALRNDGTVWAWGNNTYGQLGNGTTTDTNCPVQVVDLSGVSAVSAGGGFSLVLKSDGTVWAWGGNWIGQLGNGTTTDTNHPVQVVDLSGVSAVSASGAHSLALKSDGTVPLTHGKKTPKEEARFGLR